MKKVFVMIAAVALVLTACKKDDDTSSTLYYRGKTVTEFKMYVGSTDGGKEVDLIGVAPEKYWSGITKKEIGYTGQYMKFEEGKAMYSGNNNKPYDYKFVGDSLMTYGEDGWDFSGFHGSISKLTSESYYYIGSSYSYSGKTTLQDVLKEKGISSLSDLKSITDTIGWANVVFVFE